MRFITASRVLLGASILLATPLAAGQSEAPARSADRAQAQIAAESLFDEAKALVQQGRWEEACPKFEESLRLDRAGGTLLNLARCHEHTGQLALAWTEYADALALAKQDARPDRAQAAQASMDAIAPRLPHLRVHVAAATRAMSPTIRLNGAVLNPPSWDERLPVDPGRVSVSAEAPAHRPWATSISIAEGQEMEIEVPALAPAPVTAPTAHSSWSSQRTVAVVVGLAGLAAIGVGTYYGLQTLSDRNASDGACPSRDGAVRCSVQGSSDMSNAFGDAWISDIALGAGALALVGSAYLYLTGAPKQAQRPAVGLLTRPGGGGLTFGGAW